MRYKRCMFVSELEKMTAGELYNPADGELYAIRTRAHRLCQLYNQLPDTDEDGRNEILRELLPNAGRDIYLQGPLYFDYGINIYTGSNVYANFNLTVLDVCPVRIGNNVMLGTSVSLLTPVHPMRWQERNGRVNASGELEVLEFAKPITIGDNCWLAGNVTVTGGVTIGSGSVIGAGSVVTRDIPADVFAAGVPCRVVKAIS